MTTVLVVDDEPLILAFLAENLRADDFTVLTATNGGEAIDALAASRPDVVLLGSDFPTLPYPYAHQLEALERLGLGDDWLRAVCWENGERLLGERPR